MEPLKTGGHFVDLTFCPPWDSCTSLVLPGLLLLEEEHPLPPSSPKEESLPGLLAKDKATTEPSTSGEGSGLGRLEGKGEGV